MKEPDFKSFADDCLSVAWEGNDMDGSEIQELAVKHGLLEEKTMTTQCGEDCICAEWGFPSQCYRKTY